MKIRGVKSLKLPVSLNINFFVMIFHAIFVGFSKKLIGKFTKVKLFIRLLGVLSAVWHKSRENS